MLHLVPVIACALEFFIRSVAGLAVAIDNYSIRYQINHLVLLVSTRHALEILNKQDLVLLYLMPIEPGARLVEIKSDVRTKLESYWKSGKSRAPDWKSLVNDLLQDVLDKENEFLPLYAPFLSKVVFEHDTLFIKDSKAGMTSEITLKNGRLYCNLDKSAGCIHVQFALALPEVAKLNLKRPSKK